MMLPAGVPTPFRFEERIEDDGAVRLMLLGEFDLAVADAFSLRIQELAAGPRPIKVDLSRLEFMDSTGLGALLQAVMHAHNDGFQLRIEPELTDQVRRLIELTGIADQLWPDAHGHASGEP